MMVPRWIRAGSRGHEKSPRLFQVRGVEFFSRGTTLVQPPVARTALKASNKAAANNEANRPALLALTRSDRLLRDQLSTGEPAPVCTNHRLSEGGDTLSFFPSLHLLFSIVAKEGRFVKPDFPGVPQKLR